MKNASKLIFFQFSKTSKTLLICKKRYAKILHTGGAVVTIVEKKVKSKNRIFFTSAKVAPDCRNIGYTNITESQYFDVFRKGESTLGKQVGNRNIIEIKKTVRHDYLLFVHNFQLFLRYLTALNLYLKTT